jgi:YD repeat-containing protein
MWKVKFDSKGRLLKTTLDNNGAYTRYVYPDAQNFIETYSTITEGQGEAYSATFVDGHGRTRISISDLPNAPSGIYSAVLTEYDILGRVKRQTTPTEVNFINGAYQPAGDNAANMPGRSADGWLWTQQEYDWKGRVTKSINTDGTYKLISYTGCGCAGGEITTIQGEQFAEGRRTQKVYSDFLGRESKTEILDWNGNPYATTVNTFNARDQVTLVRQYAGSEGSSIYQDTIYNYDGHGRLQSRHVPEQDTGKFTVYTYYADDKAQSMKDAREATTNYFYNDRGLLKQISYDAPQNSGITIPLPTFFGYDAVGNRIQMQDGMGNVTYEYNELSRLTSETRQFNDSLPEAPLPNNRFKLQYAYDLSGKLITLTEPYGEQIAYGHDKTGRLTSVVGTRFDGTEQVQYVNNAKYRAWGALKQLGYTNGLTMDMTYNARLQAQRYSLKKIYPNNSIVESYIDYQYYADGRLSFSDENQLHQNALGSSTFVNYPQFDRSYEYNFMGRLSIAKTGAEARGQTEPDYNKRPYRQTFTFDAFGHMNGADKWHWTEYLGYNPVFYQNNRIVDPQGVAYDADGRQLADHVTFLNKYKYDAGGRLIYIPDGNFYNNEGIGTEFWLDGTGQVLKSHEIEFEQCSTTQTCRHETTSYNIPSSVLNGEVVNEISTENITVSNPPSPSSWTKKYQNTHIIANGTRIAERSKEEQVSGGTYFYYDNTWLKNRDASGVLYDESLIQFYGSSQYGMRGTGNVKSDPFGASIGDSNPYLPPSCPDGNCPACNDPDGPCDDPEYVEDFPEYGEEGYGNVQENTCYLDGWEMPCREAFHRAGIMPGDEVKVTEVDSFNAPSTSGPQSIWKPDVKTVLLGDVANDINPNGAPDQVLAEVNVTAVDEGYFTTADEFFGWDTRELTDDSFNDNGNFDVEAIKKKIKEALEKTKCKDLVKSLLEKAGTKKNPPFEGGDIEKMLNSFFSQQKGGYTRTTPKGCEGTSACAIRGRSLKKGDAMIYVPKFNFPSNDRQTPEQQRNVQADIDTQQTIQEILHYGGTNKMYDDYDLAKVISENLDIFGKYIETGYANPFDKKDPTYKDAKNNRYHAAYSLYLHGAIRNGCFSHLGYKPSF